MGRRTAISDLRAQRRGFVADLEAPSDRGRGLWYVVGAIAAFRLVLATRGQLYWPDEFRYGRAFQAIEQLVGGNVPRMLEHVFDAAARPGYVLMGMVPAAMQSALLKTGLLSWHSPYLYDVVGVFNVGVSLAILLLFYGIAGCVLQNRTRAVGWTAVYGLLCNSNLYVRHLLPCDWALVWMMAALYLIVRAEQPSSRRAAACGALGGVGLMIYAPYYAFMFILAAGLAFAQRFQLRHVLALAGGAVAVLAAVEGAALSIGQSHIATTLRQSHEVVILAQGSFSEGLIFGPRYLASVEGPVGLALMAGGCLWLWSGRRKTQRVATAMLLAALGGYVLHGTMTLMHKSLFYGRIFHMFIPFVVLAAGLAVDHLRTDRRQRVALSGMIVASILSFLDYAPAYARLNYPRELDHRYLESVPDDEIVHLLQRPGETVERDPAVVTVNLRHVHGPDLNATPLSIPGDYRLIERQPHPLTFEPYLYEGFSIEQRRLLSNQPRDMRIYIRQPQDDESESTL